MTNKKGFTLMEMMVVVLILAGLAAISYPVYTKTIMKARLAEAISLTEIVREAQQRSLDVNGTYLSAFVAGIHDTGRTRLIKSNTGEHYLTVEGGNLIVKDLYIVTIMNETENGSNSNPVENGCIAVKFLRGPGLTDNPIFTIYAHVEDSRIWCEEADDSNGICGTIPAESFGQGNHGCESN